MTTRAVGARACLLAALLAALFEHDRELAVQLNSAQRQLLDAGDQAPGRLAHTIHSAFAGYQTVAEQRRQLSADVGEAVVRLIDAMRQDGYSEPEAGQADVWALRDGIYQPAAERTRSIKGMEPRRERGPS
jgi:Spy/CpxP family protein refolding chaperone